MNAVEEPDNGSRFFTNEYAEANSTRNKAKSENPKVFDSESYANSPVSTVASKHETNSSATFAVVALQTVFLTYIPFVLMF